MLSTCNCKLSFLFFFRTFCVWHITDCTIRPDGDICRVPNTNSLVDPGELQVGHVVTFAYESWTHKTLPTNPKIFRIRHDIEWETVVENFERKTAQEQHLNGILFVFICSAFPCVTLYFVFVC